jgi:hypothetical protein
VVKFSESKGIWFQQFFLGCDEEQVRAEQGQQVGYSLGYM